MICSSLKAQTDKLPATEDSRASGRRARGGSRGGHTGAPGQTPARLEDPELTTSAPALPLSALFTPSSLFHSFFSEGVSLMQPGFVFGDMKEIC